MLEISRDYQINNPDILSNVLGIYDENIKYLQTALNIDIQCRQNKIRFTGDNKSVQKALDVIKHLEAGAGRGEHVSKETIELFLSLEETREKKAFSNLNEHIVAYTNQGKPIRPKTFGQKKYLDAIEKNDIIFGIGPAGTGKTYLAMAKAITAFKNEEVERLILTRPAIEAGEHLGFLPGDLQEKVDPYLRPLYDALFEIMGNEAFKRNMEKGLIEVAPLAYMRGRTLENAYIILDEAQNTTPEQMKMFLTRFGQGSKIIVTGDETQIDLPHGRQSGLIEAEKILQGIRDIAFVHLHAEDVVRNRLVQKIIEAYEIYEQQNNY